MKKIFLNLHLVFSPEIQAIFSFLIPIDSSKLTLDIIMATHARSTVQLSRNHQVGGEGFGTVLISRTNQAPHF